MGRGATVQRIGSAVLTAMLASSPGRAPARVVFTLVAGSVLAMGWPAATALGTGESDLDGDTVVDAADNCPTIPNPYQIDTDENGIGNSCDCPAFGMVLPWSATQRDVTDLQFSPDGQWLVIESQNQLRSMPAEGGPIVNLHPPFSTVGVEEWVIGPDSAYVVMGGEFHNYNLVSVAVGGGPRMNLASFQYTDVEDSVGITGGAPTLIASGVQGNFRFTPDGTRVVYESVGGGLASAPVVPGSPTPISTPVSTDFEGVVITADSSHLLFIGPKEVGSGTTLYAAPLSGAPAEVLAILPDLREVTDFAVAQDSETVYFASDLLWLYPGQYSLYRALAGNADGDGVQASCDNCPHAFNPGQEDTDADRVGDACDGCPGALDVDFDGWCASVDNCPLAANPTQTDTDGDGEGDVCDACPTDPFDADADADGLCDSVDNCPTVSNPDQEDTPEPEWLEIEYAGPIRATGVYVHEAFEAGFVFQIDVRELGGALHTVWTNPDVTSCGGRLSASWPETPYDVVAVRVHTQIDQWEEIDAVELLGRAVAPDGVGGRLRQLLHAGQRRSRRH